MSKINFKVVLTDRMLRAVSKLPKAKREPVKSAWYKWIAAKQGQCWACLEQPGGCPTHDYEPGTMGVAPGIRPPGSIVD